MDRLDDKLMSLEPEEFLELEYRGQNVSDHPLYELVSDELEGWSVADELDYKWTEEDIEWVSFMAETEAKVLGDGAMYSVVSTAYERTTSVRWCENHYCSRNVTEELFRPNQFTVMDFWLSRGRDTVQEPRAYLMAYKYILDLPVYEETCAGYEFFNSIPGKPYQCRLGWDDVFMGFSSTYEFVEQKEEGLSRNILVVDHKPSHIHYNYRIE